MSACEYELMWFYVCVGVFLCFSQALEKLEQQIALLPRSNYNLLSYICR